MVWITLHRSEAQPGGGDHTTTHLGPFEWIQITYEKLECGEDGPGFYVVDGEWFPEKRVPTGPKSWSCGPDTDKTGYTDLVISDKEPKD